MPFSAEESSRVIAGKEQPVITLNAGDATAEVLRGLGCNCVRWRIAGRDMLYAPPLDEAGGPTDPRRHPGLVSISEPHPRGPIHVGRSRISAAEKRFDAEECNSRLHAARAVGLARLRRRCDGRLDEGGLSLSNDLDASLAGRWHLPVANSVERCGLTV